MSCSFPCHRRIRFVVPLLLMTLLALALPAAAEPPPPTDSANPPADYAAPAAPTAASPAATLASATVLLLKDANPFNGTANEQILAANGISYVVMSSADLPAADLSQYPVLIVAGDQQQAFYDALDANEAKLHAYVADGGALQFGAAAWGWNEGDASAVTLPGGVTISLRYEVANYLTRPVHPLVAGLPNPFSGTSASHAYFTGLPAWATVIATTGSTPGGEPTLAEYKYGKGCVLALGQPLEYGYENGQASGTILRNAILRSVNDHCSSLSIFRRIFGWLYIDTNQNGWRDVGENEGVPGQPVVLRQSGGVVKYTNTTPPRGWYELNDLPASDYCLQVLAPAGYVSTSPGEQCFYFDGGLLNVNFGLVKAQAAIGDTVYADANGNGVQDAGEPGYPNVTLVIWNAADGGPGDIVTLAQTDAAGHYSFTVTPGTYYVQVTDDQGVLTGLTLTGGANPAGPITVANGQTYADADFGYNFVCPASRSIVSGQVWVDENGDGVLGSEDTSVRGVEVCANPMSQFAAPRCDITGADGVYHLCVRPQTYLVAPTGGKGTPIQGLMPVNRAFRLPLVVKPGLHFTDVNFGFTRAMPVQ